MIFLDSKVLIDYFTGRNNWQVEVLDSILGKYLVVFGDYILTDVLQGFRSDKEYQKAKSILLSFPCFDIGGKEIALQRAKNKHYLRRKGITIRKTIVTMIAKF